MIMFLLYSLGILIAFVIQCERCYFRLEYVTSIFQHKERIYVSITEVLDTLSLDLCQIILLKSVILSIGWNFIVQLQMAALYPCKDA